SDDIIWQMPDPSELSGGDLQFQKAEFVSPRQQFVCDFCRTVIADTYYHVGGAVTCPSCAQPRLLIQGRPEGRGTFLKAALFGAGAAFAGSILYFLVSLTGFQFSIIAIVVGVMVGKAIRYVTRGRSSLRYRLLAVFLTYAAITTSSLPSMIAAAGKRKHNAATESASAAPASAPAPATKPILTPLRLVRALVIVLAFTLVLPFFAVIASP